MNWKIRSVYLELLTPDAGILTEAGVSFSIGYMRSYDPRNYEPDTFYMKYRIDHELEDTSDIH